MYHQQINLFLSFSRLIRAAVLDCPTDESESDEYLTAEQKQKLLDAKHANIRELICKSYLNFALEC